MCTVTYVRSGDKTIITSNRDEQVARQSAAPKNYLVNNKTVVFPKDPKAGGTWYAADEAANVIVLLNGADVKHQRNPPYRRSRGLIVLDMIGAQSPSGLWETIDLIDIEPFTLVVYDSRNLFQFRWNGIAKSSLKLNPDQRYIWSSATLYPQAVREQRARWFAEFIAVNPEPTDAQMFAFHRETGQGDSENGLIIDRNGCLKTVSITQTVIQGNRLEMLHYDLISGEAFPYSFITV